MTQEQINKLISLMDPAPWIDLKKTIERILFFYKNNFKIRPVIGLGNNPIPCPLDYRDLAKFILRSGVDLTKEEKKKYGIHGASKVTTSIFEHFKKENLFNCLYETQRLTLAITGIETIFSNLEYWKKDKIIKVQFITDLDSCKICKELKGVYQVNDTPIPILDTHLGCMCTIMAMID